ncbi:iron chelate uptake ABC transporter family permease subunit [Prauserella halophila]|uniref:Iron chelate uptake ABC transporter family permease subunit n=1 Tax=Prauserella halophila TaxID=185641 RepID=A0ABN1WPM3_9PSEU|nr:manganese/zinc/iron transport system permease protein [Prauserella halophila]
MSAVVAGSLQPGALQPASLQPGALQPGSLQAGPLGGLLDALPLSYPDAVVVVGTAVVGFVAGLLGPLAVLRQRSMFGDAMSHGTLAGVAVAFLLTGAKVPELLLLGAAVSATLAAFAMIALERTGRLRSDAAIGVVLSVSLTLGIVLLTGISDSGNAQQSGLDEYLLGQTAGMVERDIVVALAGAGVAVVVILLGFRLLRSATFDPGFTAVAGVRTWVVDAASTGLLALAVVLGVRTVGAILMVALLVAPVVTARQLTTRLAALLPLSAVVGAACGAVGGLVSGRAELPAGPVIVLLATALAVLAVVLAPRRGVIARARAGRLREGAAR